MDGLQAAIASLGLVALILLLVLALCHRLGPKASAWVSSEREEKIGLSKNHLFHANGYLIHQSGSDILLSSTGSFKRFESIDRDYVVKPTAPLAAPPAMPATVASTATVWTANNITAPALVASSAVSLVSTVPALPVIPPQPLRPAPAPAPSTIERRRSERAMKQRSCDTTRSPSFNNNNNTTTTTTTTAIPRPVARRQMSSPAASTQNARMLINLSAATAEMCSGPRSCTNPFRNGSIDSQSESASAAIVEPPPQPALPKPTLTSQYHFDEVFASDEVPSGVDNQRPSPAHSWLINETTGNTTPANNNPFVPDGTSASAAASLENLATQQPQRRRFDDNFLDAPLSGGTTTTDAAPLEVSSRPPLKFRSRSRSAAEIEDAPATAAYLPYGQRRKMSATEMTTVMQQQQHQQHQYQKQSQHFFGSGAVGAANTILQTTNPFKSGTLHKTLSETYLEQWTGGGGQPTRNYRSASQQWQFGKALLQRQCSNLSLAKSLIGGGGGGGGYASSGGSMSSLGSEPASPLTRAQSCESVSSDTSVRLADLEQPRALVTGQLCIGLQTDRATQTAEGIELVVTVMEARELLAPAHVPSGAPFDTFVRMYLVPDETGASQTKLFRDSQQPSYNETFSFWLSRRRPRRSLWFHLYHSGQAQHTLLGEAELPLTESMARPMTTWLSLADSKRQRSEWGDLMFSISYLPTAERLTVVVVKGRNVKVGGSGTTAAEAGSVVENVFVKVYLLKDHKKVSKKKTSIKRSDNCPIYNESMIFSVPPYMMHSVQVRLTVMHATSADLSPPPMSADLAPRRGGVAVPIGHVIVGAAAGGKGMRHWNQMLTSLRKPVAMWHPIRQTMVAAATKMGKH